MEKVEKMVETKKITVARHTPSGLLLIGEKWIMDPTDEEIAQDGNEGDYKFWETQGIVGEDSEYYNADDPEQEHWDDYDTVEYEFNIEYSEEDKKKYEEEKEIHDDNRDHFYGYSGGNTKEFRDMYGDGNYFTFFDWLLREGREANRV